MSRFAIGFVPCLVAAAFVSVPGLAHDDGTRLDVKGLTASILPPPGEVELPPSQTDVDHGAQAGEAWNGSTSHFGAGHVGVYDVHEFDVLAGFDNDMLSVRIAWARGLSASYDIDLYLDRFDAGEWFHIGSSEGGQNFAQGQAASEVVTLSTPSVGKYRARVSNYASQEIAYSGTIAFTSIADPVAVAGRSSVDRPDTTNLQRIHVIYFVPSDKPDQSLDTNGTLADSITSMNQWFEAQANGRHYRLDTFLDAGLSKTDITFVRGHKTDSQYSFSRVASELEARGFNANPGEKRYLVFAAVGASACGTAYYPILSDTAYEQWAMTFLDSPAGCKARQFGNPTTGPSYSEVISAQELLHNEGVVSLLAPHDCGPNFGHVCTAQVGAQLLRGLDPESFDIMFPYVGRPLGEKQIDIGDDDYYRHPFPYRDFDDSPFLED